MEFDRDSRPTFEVEWVKLTRPLPPCMLGTQCDELSPLKKDLDAECIGSHLIPSRSAIASDLAGLVYVHGRIYEKRKRFPCRIHV